MPLIESLKQLSSQRRWVAIGLIVAAVFAYVTVSKLAPARSHGIATAQLVIDSSQSALPDAGQPLDPLVPRAGVYANLLTSAAVLTLVGHAAGIPGDEISATGPAGSAGQRVVRPATAPSSGGYSLQYDTPNLTEPLITVVAQAPTGRKAVALANGAAVGLSAYLRQLAGDGSVRLKHQIAVRQLGAPAKSTAQSGLGTQLIVPVFLLGLAAWCVLVLLAVRFVEAWRHGGTGTWQPAARSLAAAVHHGAKASRQITPRLVGARHRVKVAAHQQHNGDSVPVGRQLPGGTPTAATAASTNRSLQVAEPNGSSAPDEDAREKLREVQLD